MSSSPPQYDLIVIGAGLAGLSAAIHFHSRTRAPSPSASSSSRILVLEAKDRVGGKTLSVPTANGGFVDLGAAWINDTNQSTIYELAKRFDVELVRQRGEGWDLHLLADGDGDGDGAGGGGEVRKVPFGGSVFPPEETENLVSFIENVDSMGPKLSGLSPTELKELDNTTLHKYCEKHFPSEAVFAVADRVSCAWLGVEASETSALFFIDYVYRGKGMAVLSSDLKDGAQYLRVRNGTQTFSKKLASTLPKGTILLSHPVSSISQTKDGICTVHSSATGFTATSRKVIVSVPTPLYRHISFSPPLPANKAKFAQSTTLGYYSKMILIFDRPWWRDADLSGRLNSPTGPFAFTRDTSADMDGQFSLTCFVVGEEGRKWSKLGVNERKRQVLEQYAKFAAGYRDVPEPIQILEKEWVKEQWSEGAPNPVPDLGAFADAGVGGVEALKEPFGSIHFVGTETADVWRGYMDGAVRSGERGAAEVVKALHGTSSLKASL